MRIAVVHSFYASDQPSGENVTVEAQVGALREAGHDVRPVARRTDDLVDGPGYALRSAAGVATGVGPSPARDLADFDPDVVHVHNTFPNFGTRWLHHWGTRSVVTLHNFRTVCAAGTLFRDGHDCTECLRRPAAPAVRHACYRDSRLRTLPLALGTLRVGGLHPLLSRPARLICLNPGMAETIGRAAGRSVDVVPNFVPAAPERDVVRSGWAYVGRLTADKGIRELLAVWPAGERLTVYGDGPLHAELTAAPAPQVDFRGRVPHETVLDELDGYEGLVVPSLWREGLPTVIIEALARGLPLLISDRMSCAAELRQAGAAAGLDMTAVTAELVRRQLDRVRAEGDRMGEASRRHYQSHHAPSVWLGRIEEIYADVRGR